jgi:hypothetical protein
MAAYYPFHPTQSTRVWELNPQFSSTPRHTPIIDSWKAPKTIPIEVPIEHTEGLKIVIILDESGSMSNIKHQIIISINDLIKEQRTIKGRPATLTLIKFNDHIDRIIKNKNLEQVELLSCNDYKPSGSTALFDAIGSTVNWFRYESDVLMVIVTDGLENASKDYNRSMINQMLEEKKVHRNWSYVYLSNNLENAGQGLSMGIGTNAFCSNVVVNQDSYGSYISSKLNVAIGNLRSKGVSVQSQLNSK